MTRNEKRRTGARVNVKKQYGKQIIVMFAGDLIKNANTVKGATTFQYDVAHDLCRMKFRGCSPSLPTGEFLIA